MNAGSRGLLLALALSGVVLLVCSGVVAGDGGTTLRMSEEVEEPDDGVEEVVVRFTPASDAADAEELRRHAAESQSAFHREVEDRGDVEVVRRFWISNSALVEVEDDAVEDVRSHPDVVAVHPNYMYRVAQMQPERSEGAPGDIGHVRSSHGYTVDYGVETVNATAVWNETMGEGVKVAVLDTGVEPSHSDLDLYSRDANDSRRPGGWSEFDSQGRPVDSEPYDSGVHGTHVSGTVAGDDGSGVYIGVAPEAELLHSKVFDVGGTFAQINAGMEWALEEEEADVLSLSFGVACEPDGESSRYVEAMVEPVVNAESAGTFVVAATGNGGEGCTSSPSNVPEAFAVGAVDRFLEVPSFSGGGEVNTSEAWGEVARENWTESYVVPDVVAPGVEVVSAVPDGGYRQMDGTSMAAPHVAGAAALVQSASDERLEPDELREALERSAWKPDGAPGEKDVRYGDGVVDVYTAREHVRPEEDGEEEDGDGGNETGDGSGGLPEEMPGMGFVSAVAALTAFLVLSRKT